MIHADSTDLVFLCFMKYITQKYTNTESHGAKSFSWDVGSKYIRIWRIYGDNSRHSYCFIERATGNVYKCATYKAPVKHARGNIFDGFNDPELYGVSQYGARYLIFGGRL
jgi:hypothetical protein